MQGIGNNSGFRNITVAELEMLLQRGCLRLLDVRARHGEAEPSSAGVPASHLLSQSAGCASNVSEVRTDAEMARGRIPQGVSLPLHLLPLRLNEMDKNAATVFYCQMGGRSGQAAAFAAASGFAEVYNLQGGIIAWVQAGLPIAS
ncbi:MAG TPA: rhodanese-like domain-containing protein [Gallionella sp.]